jgi:hypothetical protein
MLVAVFGFAACGEAELDEVPETAEIESDDDMGDLELDEETILGADDIGEDIMATGWVSGLPLANGFFLLTEDDRIIFVESEEQVSAGDMVRVAGPLVATQATVFEGWETEAFEAGFEAEWDVETIAFIDAFTVTHLDGEPAGEPGQETGAASPGMDGGMEEDPGSKSGG